jgi:hypothetical protein
VIKVGPEIKQKLGVIFNVVYHVEEKRALWPSRSTALAFVPALRSNSMTSVSPELVANIKGVILDGVGLSTMPALRCLLGTTRIENQAGKCLEFESQRYKTASAVLLFEVCFL